VANAKHTHKELSNARLTHHLVVAPPSDKVGIAWNLLWSKLKDFTHRHLLAHVRFVDLQLLFLPVL
jgi:hypothetical protein